MIEEDDDWGNIEIGDRIKYFDGEKWVEGVFVGYWGYPDDQYGDYGWKIRKDSGYELWEDLKDIHSPKKII